MIQLWSLLSLATLLLVLGGCASTSKVPSRVISDQGFTELTPPSTLVPPATYIMVREEVPFRVGTVCRAEDAFGSDIPVRTSRTREAEIIEEKSRNVTLEGGYLNQIRGEARYSSVKNITYTLENATIVEVDDARFFSLQGQLTESCAEALAFRWGNGHRISLIKEVLQADVTYRFEFDNSAGLSVEAQQGLVKDLSARLGADARTAGSNSVKGQALFWGVVDDVELACRLAPNACASAPEGASRGAGEGNSLLFDANAIDIEAAE